MGPFMQTNGCKMLVKSAVFDDAPSLRDNYGASRFPRAGVTLCPQSHLRVAQVACPCTPYVAKPTDPQRDHSEN